MANNKNNNTKNNTNLLNYLGDIGGIAALIQCHMSRIILPYMLYENHRIE